MRDQQQQLLDAERREKRASDEIEIIAEREKNYEQQLRKAREKLSVAMAERDTLAAKFTDEKEVSAQLRSTFRQGRPRKRCRGHWLFS